MSDLLWELEQLEKASDYYKEQLKDYVSFSCEMPDGRIEYEDYEARKIEENIDRIDREIDRIKNF